MRSGWTKVHGKNFYEYEMELNQSGFSQDAGGEPA